MPKTKVCTKCGKRKPLGEYHADKRRKDGKRPECKECRNASLAERLRKDPEYRKRRYVASAAWAAKNRERKAAMDAAWSARNRERKAASSAAWRERNREWCNVLQQLRRIGGF